MRDEKRLYQLFCQAPTWKAFTTWTNGHFYQFLPNKIYQIKSEKSSGETLSKIRITSMAATNAIDEEKSPTLGVVTKFQKNVALTIDTFG